MFEKFIASLAAKGLKISNRTRVSRENFQRAVVRYFFQCFAGFQDRQRAIKALCVKSVISH
jgi:hypothetical protein